MGGTVNESASSELLFAIQRLLLPSVWEQENEKNQKLREKMCSYNCLAPDGSNFTGKESSCISLPVTTFLKATASRSTASFPCPSVHIVGYYELYTEDPGYV